MRTLLTGWFANNPFSFIAMRYERQRGPITFYLHNKYFSLTSLFYQWECYQFRMKLHLYRRDVFGPTYKDKGTY